MDNIFENAKFGDKFLTRDNHIAIYNCYVDKPLSREGSHHELIIQGASGTYDFSENGKDIYFEEPCINDIISRYQEPINEKKLDKLADNYAIESTTEIDFPNMPIKQFLYEGFKEGYRKAKQE